MSNNLTINLQNISDEDKKVLMEIMERSNKPKSRVWKPKEGETVYALWNNGDITAKSCQEPLLRAYGQGNVFPTKDRAEFERERRKFLKRWKDLSIESGELENPWDGINKHWGCYYDIMNGGLRVRCSFIQQDGGIYFPNRESVESAIEELGEENIKKYILGV